MVVKMQCSSVSQSIHIKVSQEFRLLVSVFLQLINKIGSIRLLDFGQLEAGAKIYSFIS